MNSRDESSERTPDSTTPTLEQEASQAFVQRLYSDWTTKDQTAVEARLEGDADFADAWRRTDRVWNALDTYAETPEIMAYRAEAIAEMRRANSRRWYTRGARDWLGFRGRIAASLVGALILLGILWQISPYGYRPGTYRTDIGEQRIVELADHSRITMDAATRLEVHFSDDARNVRLLGGQAQFSVAHDPSRPFKVIAGDRAVVAIGTVFTVEYVDRKIHVAMLEGKVAVVPGVEVPKQKPVSIELSAGEELRVAHDGLSVVTQKADLEAATAWREGKVIFRSEPLVEAVDRMNRYSRLQVKIDDAELASKHISGVFEAGDTRGFVNALERYLLVTADYSNAGTVRLKPR